jgi:uncharacterized protein YjbI with pentapeptide repeats
MEAEDFEKIMQLYFSGSDSRALAVELMKVMEYELAEMFEEEIICDFAFDKPEDYFDMMNDLTFYNCSFEGIKFEGNSWIRFECCTFDKCNFVDIGAYTLDEDCCLTACDINGEISYEDIKDIYLKACRIDRININEAEDLENFRNQLYYCTIDTIWVDIDGGDFCGDELFAGCVGHLSNCYIEGIKDLDSISNITFYNCTISDSNLDGYFDGDVCRIYDCNVSGLEFPDGAYNEVSGDFSYCTLNFYGIDYEVQNILTGAELGEKFDMNILSWTYEISEINLDGKGFIDFDFSEKNMEKMSFVDCDLEDCDFRRSYLGGTDFEGANLEGAIFRGAELTGVNFENADLTNADFTESTDYFKDIFNDHYYENNESTALDELLFEPMEYEIELLSNRKDFCYENFDNCSLIAVKFDHKDLVFASFRNADLSNASFKNCNLRDVDFSGAILHGAYFGGANLEDAIFTDAKIKDAVFDDYFEYELFESYDETDDEEIDEEEAPELDLEDFPWRIRY